jgi:UDP-N-acetylmuramyl-tripeptide synthetase
MTTPESADLQKYLAQMVDGGVSHLVTEVSSHSLALKRVNCVDFDVAVYTNLSHDHLDFHRTLEAYLDAKLKLFRSLGTGKKKDVFAAVNIDDEYSDAVIEESGGEIIKYSLKKKTDVRIKNMQVNFDGMMLTAVTPKGDVEISTPLVGTFNAYNILAAISAGIVLGIDPDKIKSGIELLKNVPGRFEKVNAGQKFPVIVDFAHSPDSLRKLLETARMFKKGRVILVFGCTGDRDKLKRPVMGEIAGKLSDFSIISTDDPHKEDPEQIIKEIETGMKQAGVPHEKYLKITDRRNAIYKAIEIANEDDIVIIAGRGHEKSQDWNGKKVGIDDRETARKAVLEKLH